MTLFEKNYIFVIVDTKNNRKSENDLLEALIDLKSICLRERYDTSEQSPTVSTPPLAYPLCNTTPGSYVLPDIRYPSPSEHIKGSVPANDGDYVSAFLIHMLRLIL